jgi:hypothetical protein
MSRGHPTRPAKTPHLRPGQHPHQMRLLQFTDPQDKQNSRLLTP